MKKYLISSILILFSSLTAYTTISELTKEAMAKPPEKEIKFYYPTMPYFEFTNFWPGDPVLIDGKSWPTTEHYYQAQKFVGENEYIQEIIRNMATPDEVFKLANTRDGTEKDKIRKDWNDILVDVMRKAVKAKFEQYPDLMEVLKSTKDSELIEWSKHDAFWGVANKTRDGYTAVTPLNNWLGKLLMEVRDGVQKYVYNPKDY